MRVSGVMSPSFGTRVYYENKKYKNIAQICAQKLNEEDDSIKIGDFKKPQMAPGDGHLRSSYKPVIYQNKDGYTDQILVNFDMAKQSKEEIADTIVNAYHVLKQREPLVQDMRKTMEKQYQPYIKLMDALQKIQEQQQALKSTLFTPEFENKINKAQEVLNNKTTDWANQAGIDVYVKAGGYNEIIKENCGGEDIYIQDAINPYVDRFKYCDTSVDFTE